MNACRRKCCPLMTVLAIVSAATAGVPPVTYLVPDRYAPARDQVVNLHVESGTALAAKAAPWPAKELDWFFTRGSGTQENRDTVAPVAPELSSVVVKIAQPGVTVIGFNKKPALSAMPGADLSAFLSANGAGAQDNPAFRKLADTQSVRVRRYESATTMVRVPAGDVRDQHSAVAQAKTGQTVEIQPLFDPTKLTVGSDLPVRVHLRGVKQEGAKVRATTLAGGQTTDKVTDAAGSTYFPITHAGVWRLEFHQAEPVANDASADWAIYSATLTFEVPAEGGAK